MPLTPRAVRVITVRLPNPLRAAAVAALLFTGTATSLLSMTQIGSIDEDGTTVTIDRDSRTNIGEAPGPRHLYAVPPRARPLLHAAVEFRRRTPRTADHHGLFANCFGTAPRFEALTADAGIPIPALLHPHTGRRRAHRRPLLAPAHPHAARPRHPAAPWGVAPVTDQPPLPGNTSAAAFDLMFLRTRAAECRLTDEDLAALTGIPTADWDTHTLPAAALLALARALNTSPESLLRVPEYASRRSVPGAATHATVLHAALLEVGRIHPDDLASALEWPPYRLERAAGTLAAHLDQPGSPQRLIHTDTTIHLATVPGCLTPSSGRTCTAPATPPPLSPPARPPPSPACCTAPPTALSPTCPLIRSRA